MYLIQLLPTATAARRQRWQQIFGAEQIQVIHARPRETCTADGRIHLVYDVDIRALDETVVRRLANHLAARTWKLPFDQALADITAYGYQVSAADTEVIEAEVSPSAFSLLYHIISYSPYRFLLTPEHPKEESLARPLPNAAF